MKREAEDDDDVKKEEPGKRARTAASDNNDDDDDDDDLDAPVSGASRRAGGVKRGAECPYLDTVSRQVRDHCLILPKILWIHGSFQYRGQLSMMRCVCS